MSAGHPLPVAAGAARPSRDGEALPPERARATPAAVPPAAADADLLALARAGDRAAFGGLVARHHRTLAAVLRQRFGSRAPVEDLLQEVFARALARLDGFEGRSSFLTWATSIALHLGADWRRTTQRRRRLAPPSATGPDEVPGPAGADGPEAVAERREEVERVRAALDLLPDGQRLAVTLRHVEGHAYDEVARRLGVSAELARAWTSRGVRAIRDRLGGDAHA